MLHSTFDLKCSRMSTNSCWFGKIRQSCLSEQTVTRHPNGVSNVLWWILPVSILSCIEDKNGSCQIGLISLNPIPCRAWFQPWCLCQLCPCPCRCLWCRRLTSIGWLNLSSSYPSGRHQYNNCRDITAPLSRDIVIRLRPLERRLLIHLVHLHPARLLMGALLLWVIYPLTSAHRLFKPNLSGTSPLQLPGEDGQVITEPEFIDYLRRTAVITDAGAEEGPIQPIAVPVNATSELRDTSIAAAAGSDESDQSDDPVSGIFYQQLYLANRFLVMIGKWWCLDSGAWTKPSSGSNSCDKRFRSGCRMLTFISSKLMRYDLSSIQSMI